MSDGPVPAVLAAVRADLAALGDLTGGARGSLAALALYLAEVIDTRGADAPPAASARLAQELRATLQALTEKRDSDPDRLNQFFGEMGAPADLPPEVGDTPDPGPADPGPEGRGDREGAR